MQNWISWNLVQNPWKRYLKIKKLKKEKILVIIIII